MTSGEYKVTVEYGYGEEKVLAWNGYAENISDALYKALNQRDEELAAEPEFQAEQEEWNELRQLIES